MDKNGQLKNVSVFIILFLTFPTLLSYKDGSKPSGPSECIRVNAKTLRCMNVIYKEPFDIPKELNNIILRNITCACLDAKHLLHLEWTDSHLEVINKLIRNPHSLIKLDLSHNDIKTLQQYQFQNYIRVKILNLSYNKMNTIPLQVFAPMQNLQFLDLSHNNIVTIPDNFFKFNKYLEYLLLNNNKIAKLTSNVLKNLFNLKVLDFSNNSLNSVSQSPFDSLNKLENLNLAHNPILIITNGTFRGLQNLICLNLSGNKLKHLSYGMFHFSPKVQSLTIDNTLIEIVHNTEFVGLSQLEYLSMRNNQLLSEIETYVFADTPRLQQLDIRGNALTFLPLSLANLTLKSLNISDNPWACYCKMFWFRSWAEHLHLHISLSDFGCGHYTMNMISTLHQLKCTGPILTYKTPTNVYRLKSTALLECRFSANPPPSITWVTPNKDVYHWNPDPIIPDIFHKHPHAHDQFMTPLKNFPLRIKILSNGTLYIENVTRGDCGRYICYASNPVANQTSYVLLHIDTANWNHLQIWSYIVGLQCAAAVLGISLLVQFIQYILDKLRILNICCSFCKRDVSQRARQFYDLLGTVEKCKEQQLEKLHENYVFQVHRIKHNCMQQAKWIQSSYNAQANRLKDFKDIGTQHLLTLHCQYHEQVRNIRDYTKSQLNLVRENYSFQRNEIHKFRAYLDPNDLDCIDTYLKTKLETLANFDHSQPELQHSNMSSYYTPVERALSLQTRFDDELARMHINYIEKESLPVFDLQLLTPCQDTKANLKVMIEYDKIKNTEEEKIVPIKIESSKQSTSLPDLDKQQ